MIKSDKINDMHYGSDSFAFLKAGELRNRMTEAERVLWEELRNNKFYGLKIRRQHPVSRFIVDFYCHKYKLVIELDGGIHKKPKVKLKDLERETELTEFGLNILRFKNEDILVNLSGSLEKIKNTIEKISKKTLFNDLFDKSIL